MIKSPPLTFLVYAASITVLQIIISRLLYAIGINLNGYLLSMLFNFIIIPVVYLFALNAVYKNDTGEKGAGHVFWGAFIFVGTGILAGLIFFLINSQQGYMMDMAGWLMFMLPQYGSWLVMLLVFALIASMWRVFKKAGQPGWACIVPIYNYIVMLKIAGKPAWWVAIILLVPVLNIVFLIMMFNGISKAFGKGAGFTVGLVLLGIIFFPILAYSSAKYTAPPAKA